MTNGDDQNYLRESVFKDMIGSSYGLRHLFIDRESLRSASYFLASFSFFHFSKSIVPDGSVESKAPFGASTVVEGVGSKLGRAAKGRQQPDGTKFSTGCALNREERGA